MLKHVSDNSKDVHDLLLHEYDCVDLPEDPRLTREVWKKTCSISFDDMRTWVLYEGDKDVWNAGIDDLEAYSSAHGAGSVAWAGLMYKKEHGTPLWHDTEMVHILFPSSEMLELFDNNFNSKSTGYIRSAGKSPCAVYFQFICFASSHILVL